MLSIPEHVAHIYLELSAISFQISNFNLTLVCCINSNDKALCQSVCDLGVAVRSNMKLNVHCTNTVLRANAGAKLILRSPSCHMTLGVYLALLLFMLGLY
jgi:hypothetical protein